MRRVNIITLVIWLLAAAVVTAQEELPPPPPVNPGAQPTSPTAPPRQPLRGERVDRLRQLGGRLLDGLATAPVGTAQPGGPGVDVGQLNQGVEELVNPIV